MNANQSCLVREAPIGYNDPRYYGRPVDGIGKVRVLNAGSASAGEWFVTYGTQAEIVQGPRSKVDKIIRDRFGKYGAEHEVNVRPMTDADWELAADITRSIRESTR